MKGESKMADISEKIPCEYCGTGWKPLFRIIDTYKYDEYVRETNCEDCEHGDFFAENGFAELLEQYPDLTPEQHKQMRDNPCYECEKQPYRNVNSLNLTIAVTGKKLMFEDKENGYHKRYIDIGFCPACGREL